MNEDNELVLYDEDGKEYKYMIISAFKYKDKNYIIYTDNVKDSDDKLKVMAAMYDPVSDNIFDIETEEEWEYVNMIINNLSEGVLLK